MAIGERIHFFRLLRGMTQKYLGMSLGFPEKSADVRLAQYETGSRTPKADLTAALAEVLDVSLEGRCAKEQGRCPAARDALLLAASRCPVGGGRNL